MLSGTPLSVIELFLRKQASPFRGTGLGLTPLLKLWLVPGLLSLGALWLVTAQAAKKKRILVKSIAKVRWIQEWIQVTMA